MIFSQIPRRLSSEHRDHPSHQGGRASHAAIPGAVPGSHCRSGTSRTSGDSRSVSRPSARVRGMITSSVRAQGAAARTRGSRVRFSRCWPASWTRRHPWHTPQCGGRRSVASSRGRRLGGRGKQINASGGWSSVGSSPGLACVLAMTPCRSPVQPEQVFAQARPRAVQPDACTPARRSPCLASVADVVVPLLPCASIPRASQP
jgi:hypothetical protein